MGYSSMLQICVRCSIHSTATINLFRSIAVTKDLENGAATNPDPKTIAGDSFPTDINDNDDHSASSYLNQRVMLLFHRVQ